MALASGATVKAAARKAGIGERTLYKWLAKPTFKAKVNRLRDAAVSQAVALLSRDMVAAANVLKRLLKSKKEDVALRAARAILELGIDAREHEDLVRRISELELREAERGRARP